MIDEQSVDACAEVLIFATMAVAVDARTNVLDAVVPVFESCVSATAEIGVSVVAKPSTASVYVICAVTVSVFVWAEQTIRTL